MSIEYSICSGCLLYPFATEILGGGGLTEFKYVIFNYVLIIFLLF